jgi:hypothetical protein
MSKSIEIQSPNTLKLKPGFTTVFLGGSIEMGVAEEWQQRLVKELGDENYIFFNPRRTDWDSTWEQEITNPQFKEQVQWELEALEIADVIIMYFDPNTKSPISLLELGLHAKERKLVVLCPEGFWRKGNVDIVCEMYSIKQVASFDELIELFKTENIKRKLSTISK